ncbi:hypothetical protein BGI35_02010 [Snodgrassella communis]|jgi:hypothetical protein|nr:hypothetical protein BGI35_02010 [Snodgrassella communis]
MVGENYYPIDQQNGKIILIDFIEMICNFMLFRLEAAEISSLKQSYKLIILILKYVMHCLWNKINHLL